MQHRTPCPPSPRRSSDLAVAFQLPSIQHNFSRGLEEHRRQLGTDLQFQSTVPDDRQLQTVL